MLYLIVRSLMMNNIIWFFLILGLLVQAQKVPKESVEYYLSLLLDFLHNSLKWEYPTDSRRFFKLINEQEEAVDHGHYHFIIVGAGVAGSVLANRLTESGKFKILVLEAGGPENDFTDVPAFVNFLTRSDFNWGYKTIPEKDSCLGFKNKQCSYHRGRAIGGSSVINFMIYVRGNKEDFDKLGRDNPGWDYESVLQYFRKSENSTLDLEDPGYHGNDGPLSIENVKYNPEITQIFLEAAKQRGQKILDYNGQNQMGYSTIQMMSKNGRRCNASKAFIKPALNRKNLELLNHALGIKILIKNKKAYGVEFIREGKKYRATTSREVIISGGSINSPQILMLSGIGPKEHLEQLGIPFLHVGNTLDDNFIYPGLFFSTNISRNNEPTLQEHIKNYLKGYGFLTATTATAVGFECPRIPSSLSSVEYIMLSVLMEETTSSLLNFYDMSKENWDALSKPVLGKCIYNIVPSLLHPKSKGTIKLKTKDPLDFPIIEISPFSDKGGEDLAEMLAVIKDIFRISKTPALQSIDAKYLSRPLPACSKYKHLSRSYWRCALKQITLPVYHAVATCKMGPKYDETAVVDNKTFIVLEDCGLLMQV